MLGSLVQQQALGLDVSALSEWQQGEKCFLVHQDMILPLMRLQEDARLAGFDLQLVSAHRSFSRQLAIWNAKASGQRPLLDAQGLPLDCSCLTPEQKLFAIMRWSAVPGLSRHHWGTDIDIYDANCMALEDVQLLPAEVEGDGPCADMHRWLSTHIAKGTCRFYRPYLFDHGGIAPEMWHISYLPVARTYLRELDPDILLPLWKESGMLLIDEILANLTWIWKCYVQLDVSGQPGWVPMALDPGVFPDRI